MGPWCAATVAHTVFSSRTIGKGTILFLLLIYVDDELSSISFGKKFSLHIFDKKIKIKTVERVMPDFKLTLKI